MSRVEPPPSPPPSPPLALVTGGTRRIGAAIADRLADAGYRVVAHARATSAENETDNAAGDRVLTGDLADPAVPERLIDAFIVAHGRAPDVLVNNASSFDPEGWADADPTVLARSMQVNCLAPIALARTVVLRARAGQRPAIVNILDQRVANPVGDQFAYTIAKQALWQATRTLAVAFAARARVNAVAPGPTLATPDYDAAHWRRVGAMLPLGAHPAAAAIADAVLHLAQAEATTGQTLFVDAGAHLVPWTRDFANL